MKATAMIARTLLGGALVMASTGCYSTWEITPKSVASLNGWNAAVEEAPVTDEDGSVLSFDQSTELHFFGADSVPKAKFSSIQVNGSTFTGIALPDGRPIVIDLNRVTIVKAKKFSALKTALAIGIPVLAVTALIILVAVASANNNSGCGDGC